MFSATKRCQIRGSADRRTRKSRDAPGKKDNGDENQLLRLVKSNNTTSLMGITGHLNQGTYNRVPVSERSIHCKPSKKKSTINVYVERKVGFLNKTGKPVWRGREEKDDGLLTITGLK